MEVVTFLMCFAHVKVSLHYFNWLLPNCDMLQLNSLSRHADKSHAF